MSRTNVTRKLSPLVDHSPWPARDHSPRTQAALARGLGAARGARAGAAAVPVAQAASSAASESAAVSAEPATPAGSKAEAAVAAIFHASKAALDLAHLQAPDVGPVGLPR